MEALALDGNLAHPRPPPTTILTNDTRTIYIARWKNPARLDSQALSTSGNQGHHALQLTTPARTRRHATSPSLLTRGRLLNVFLVRGHPHAKYHQNWRY